MTLRRNENGYWEIWIRLSTGRCRSKSTKTKDRAKAEKIAKDCKIEEIEAASRAGLLTMNVLSVLTSGKAATTVEGALEAWNQAQRDRGHSPASVIHSGQTIRHFCNDLGLLKLPIVSITENHISSWINRECPVKAISRVRFLGEIRALFSFCLHKGWIYANPSALVTVDLSKLSHSQKEKVKRIPFTDEEVERILEITGPTSESKFRSAFWHAATAISRWTGLRLGDICRLEWASLNNVPGRIVVWTMKMDKRIDLPIEPQRLQDIIDNLINEDPQYVFPFQRAMHTGQLFQAYLSTDFTRILRNLGIKGKSFHCLRHTYIEACHSAGMPMPHIAQNVGHSHTATTRGYLMEA